MNKIYSINEINNYISDLLNSNNNLINISIEGEISNFVKHTSGHYYLTLKDNNSYLKAIIFKNNVKNININLKEGLKIIAKGTIKGYSNGGSYSF